MTAKSQWLRWRRALRRARDLLGLILVAIAYVLRTRASRRRWQSHRDPQRLPS